MTNHFFQGACLKKNLGRFYRVDFTGQILQGTLQIFLRVQIKGRSVLSDTEQCNLFEFILLDKLLLQGLIVSILSGEVDSTDSLCTDSCNYHGVCTDKFNDFSCKCDTGYDGDHCIK